jgi:hypothetical protein
MKNHANEVVTMEEIKRNIGVGNVDKVNWIKGTYLVVNTIRIGLAMSGVIKAGTVAATVMGVGAVLAPIAGLITAFCAIGIPAAQAKEIVGKKGGRHGYSIGLALAAFGYNKYFASTFIDNTSGHPGVAPAYMTGVYKTAYNTSMMLGYCAGNQLTKEEKSKLTEKITKFIIRDARKGNYQVNMEAWSDRDWVHNYARAINNNMIGD